MLRSHRFSLAGSVPAGSRR